jgi:chromosome segregation ATPase
MVDVQDPLLSLSKASRRFALLSFISLLLVFAALAYASVKLRSLESRTSLLNTEIAAKTKTEAILERQIAGLNQEIQVKTEVSQRLDKIIAGSKDKQLVQQAQQAQISPLTGFKLGIYYLEGNLAAAQRARDLASALTANHFPGTTIQLYSKETAFFEMAAAPNSDEVRYEPGFETAQAQALLKLLSAADPRHTYALREVANRTANFISIFLHDGF